MVRVDPVENSQSWQALCFEPCKADADCAPQNQGDAKAFVCEDGSCQRSRNENSYWARGKVQEEELVIVTGANSGYFTGLSNLATSARYWAPKICMVVYNLGMEPWQLEKVSSWPNIVELRWKDGIPKSYPLHVHSAKKYAWKPLAIQESLEKYGMVFWLDAGSTLTGPLDNMQHILEQTGAFLVKGQDLDMKQKSAKETYEWFGVNKSTFLVGPHYSGGTVAFLLPSRYADAIAKPNAECALEENCIAPPNSSLGNHRYDQTTLSILAYKVQTPHHTEFLAALPKQLNRDLDQPNFMFVWTARQGCKHYLQKGY